MVYSASRCPKCGQVIKRRTNPVHEIGSPFEHCRWCGGVYLNSYKEEWITKSPVKRFFFFLQIYVWARAFLMPVLLMIVLTFVGFDIATGLMRVLWPIGSVAWLVAGYFVHKNANQADINASIARTKDPAYVDLLIKAGYKIYRI